MFARHTFAMLACALGLAAAACTSAPPPAPTAAPKAAPPPTAAPQAPAAPAPTAAPKVAATTAPAAAAPTAAPKPPAKEEKNAIKFGYLTSYFNTAAVIAMREKMFEAEGLKMEYVPFTLGRNAAQALVGGSVDMAPMGAQPFISAASQIDVVALGVGQYNGKGESIVVKKDSAIKTPADLKGKKIALAVGAAIEQVVTRKYLPKYGLKEGDYQIINMDTATYLPALQTGSIDAFAMSDPFPIQAEEEGIGRILLNFDEDPYPSIYVAHRPFIEANPNTTVKYMTAIVKASRLVQDDPSRAGKIMREFMASQKIDFTAEAADRMIRRMDAIPFFIPTMAGYLNEFAEPEFKKGNIKRIPEWNKVLVPDYLDKAAAAVGVKNPYK